MGRAARPALGSLTLSARRLAKCDNAQVGDPFAQTGIEGLTVRELLDALAQEEPGPAASTAAALAAAAAAALVEMAARRSSDWPEAKGIAAQAAARRARLTELAAAGAEAFSEAVEALERRKGVEPPLRRTVELLLQVADAAGDVGELAAYAAERSDWSARPDAASAALLAEAAVATAALLVRVNLTVVPDDDRLQDVSRAEAGANVAARRALEAV
jgi:methenyltetrahydrofolate cyclohydrolase